MSRLSCACFFLAAAGLLGANGSAHAQAKPENVHFPSPDGVKLRGQFYPAQGKCLATVIMLHGIGEGKDSSVIEWKNLAEALQKADYAVLTFDFRGHGDSNVIADTKAFWSIKANGNVKAPRPKGGGLPEEIDVKDYIKQGSAYLPVLVNDIAAARAYLDRRNDTTKDCNTSSIIVIGADTGATLGAIWLNEEWNRKKIIQGANPLKLELAKNFEGSDIIGAVFLSITPNLEKRTISLPAVLRVACKENGTAVGFFVGKDDKKGVEYAQAVQKSIKVKDSKKHALIFTAELPETNLSGMKLLTKGLKTEKYITDYLVNVVTDRGAEWSDHEFDKSIYLWPNFRLPNGQPMQAKRKGDKTLVFDDYNRFAP